MLPSVLAPILASLVLVLAAPLRAGAADDAWTQALARLDAGDAAGARAVALPAGRPLPATGRGLYVLGRIRLAEGDVQGALDSLEKAAGETPRDADVQYWLGIACYEKTELPDTGKLAKLSLARRMRSAWSTAVEIDPAHLRARRALVDFYADAPAIAGGDRDDALAHARELAKHHPCDGALAIGGLLLRDEKPDDAVAQIESATRRCPDRPGVFTELGAVQIGIGRHAEGRASIAEALRRDPQDLRALYQLGKYGALTGLELDAAAAALETVCGRVPEADPVAAAAHWRLGLVRQKQGDVARARTEYERALRLNPKLGEARESLKALPAPVAAGG